MSSPNAPSASPTPAPAGRVFRVVGRILRMARPYSKTYAAGFFLFLVATVLSLLLPLGVKALLDTALVEKDTSLLHVLALALLGLFVARFAVAYLGSYCLLIVGERVAIDLRSRLFGHLQSLDLRFFTGHRTGDLISRLTSDSASIRGAINENLVSTVLTIFQVVAALGIMLVLNWRLAVIVALAAPAATLLSHVYGPRLQQLSRESMEKIGRAVSFAQERLAGFAVVQAFDRREHENRSFEELLSSVLGTAKASAKVNSLFRALVNLATSVTTIALFWFGGLEVLAGRLSVGDLVAFLFYAQSVAAGIGQTAQQYGALSSLVGASERVFEILALKPSVVSHPDALQPAAATGRIDLERVHFSYGEEAPVIEDLSISIEPGETVGVVGLSGAGKTTLLQLLCRFYDPTGGRILFDGHELPDIDLGWLRRQIALVGQDTFLFCGTVRDNIRYGRLDASDGEVEQAARAANAEEFILRLPQGYDTEVGERGVKLSTGQRQRLTLARALIKRAPILILDEATSSVDTISERLIQQALESGRSERTTIIVAHRLATVRNADRILVLRDGKIIDSGRHDELILRDGWYNRLIEAQVEPVARAASA